MHEILWHGRGGQGVVVAAQIMAEAAYLQGYKGVTSAPTFGPERRGAPLTASTRISDEPIRTFSQIERADIVVVLDETIFKVVDVLSRAKNCGTLIVNTAQSPDILNLDSCLDIATVDAAGISLKHRLMKEGAPVVNTPLLGAVARATGIVSLENIERALKGKISQEALMRNYATVKAAFEMTTMKKCEKKMANS
ncbi:MAG: 2-oxoacid:acceptor oxidoreductase family protein [Syntrophales bacterium]|nr:2-oxoacid:acceptor oxidoreductase family protein [Syntrophales bacterium]